MKYIQVAILHLCITTTAFAEAPKIPGFEKIHLGDDIGLVKKKLKLKKCFTQTEASYLQYNEIACSVDKSKLRKIKIANTIPLSNLTLTFRAEKLHEVIANIDYVSEKKYPSFTDGYNQNKSATAFLINWLHEQYGQPTSKTAKQWSSKGHIDRRWAPSEKTIEWHINESHVKAIYEGRYNNAGIAIYWF